MTSFNVNKLALLLLALVCVAEQCYDLPLTGNYQGLYCAQYGTLNANSAFCGYVEFKENCCGCNGGSAVNPNDNCTNIALPAAWNGQCNDAPYAGDQSYCAHNIFKTNCCTCGGGSKKGNSPNPCDNCNQQNTQSCTANGNEYTCQCKSGFQGAKCNEQASANPCANNNCNVQGTQSCSANGANSYTCNCKAGFNGNKCQNNINDCVNHQCQNNGTCIDGVSSYSCNCPSGWSGNRCQTAVQAGEIVIEDSGVNADFLLSLFGSGNMVGSSGDGTWYDWSAQQGTCSLDLNGVSPLMKANVNEQTSNTKRLGVALNAAQFGANGANSLPCGMCLEARAKPNNANGVDPISTNWVPAIIQDKCPGCSAGDLDFVRKGSETGRFAIEWRAVPCPVTETDKHNMQLRWVGANIAYAVKVQVRNSRYPVKSMALLYNNKQYQLKRTLDNHFTNNGVSGLSGPLGYPYTAIICDIYNQCVFTCINPPIQNKEGSLSSQTYDIDVQFPEKNADINESLEKPTLASGQDKRCPDLGGLFGPGCGESCGKWLSQTHHHVAGDKVTHNGTTYKAQGWTNQAPNASVWAWQG